MSSLTLKRASASRISGEWKDEDRVEGRGLRRDPDGKVVGRIYEQAARITLGEKAASLGTCHLHQCRLSQAIHRGRKAYG